MAEIETFADLRKQLISERDEARREADQIGRSGNDSAGFIAAARRYHALASAVGYPDAKN